MNQQEFQLKVVADLATLNQQVADIRHDVKNLNTKVDAAPNAILDKRVTSIEGNLLKGVWIIITTWVAGIGVAAKVYFGAK